MGITASLLIGGGAGFSAFQSFESRKDAKKAARKTEDEANSLKEEEERNRLQSVMRMQRRRGFGSNSGLTPNPALQLGALGSGGGKTLLGL